MHIARLWPAFVLGSGGAALGPTTWAWTEKAVEGAATAAIKMHVDKRGWLMGAGITLDDISIFCARQGIG